jgi:hypothetical protein
MMMTEDQKAKLYGNLTTEHRMLFNEINNIKGQSLELSKEQIQRIKMLEHRQKMIMEQVKRLFN